MSGSVDFAATDFSGITSITLGTPTPFTAEVEITTDGNVALPHLETPRVGVKLIASIDDTIDDDDMEVPYYLSQCQVNGLAAGVTGGTTETVDLSDTIG